MKDIYKAGLRIIITLLIVIFSNNLFAQIEKPDLIISNVELKYITYERTHKPGKPVRGGYNSTKPIFYITIKNIGNRDLSEAFYIAYTNSEQDISIGRYSRLSIVNRDKNTIKANGSLIVQVGVLNLRNNHYKFFIQSDGKSYDNQIVPRIDESNYDNNSYECIISNFH